ncbi:hypothetical protein B0H66DRAFT_565371 [Apodospora peruviana]|uniref:Uncharacterized protein n=1 Tax=Apodospora peruviana TaxID=516989 RepID=A0AAE0HYY2_9PEZI|nr:hypothetical protein B0H66DRAFT_565371 [Apodospora peruviana]
MNTQLEFRKVAYLDDTDLIGSWKALEQRINQLIPRLYDASARDPVSVGQLATLLGKVCGADLVNRPELNSQLRRQLIEAYIWRALLTDVFGASGYIWAGKAHVAIANLRSELEDYERDDLIDGGEYIQWFSRTAALMDFVWRSDPRCSERLRSVARKLRQELRLLEKSNVEEGSVERELMKVVTTACGLDFTMAKSNASYTVFMYDVRDTSPKPPPCKLHGMPFDSENMEDTYYPGAQPWNLRSRVDVVRSPGIIKIGSGLGSEYGKPTVLVKRKVLCLP